jgi:hypothetical protein
MRPYPDEVLRAIQTGVMTHLAPELKSTYANAQFAFSMMLFTIAQRDYDTAVPDLLEANKTLRALLDDAIPALAAVQTEDALAVRQVIGDLPQPSSSLALSALRSEQDALRSAASALAPLIEPANEVDALAPLRATRTAMLDWLKSDAQRRVVPILSA